MADLTLGDKQQQRLGIIQRIYQIAFVEGVIKPGRENDPPLRLTPNTDFGGWAVQEALGIHELDRTLLTYIFRGIWLDNGCTGTVARPSHYSSGHSSRSPDYPHR